MTLSEDASRGPSGAVPPKPGLPETLPLFIGIIIAAAVCHFIGRFGHHQGWYSFTVSDTLTLAALLLFGTAIILVFRKVYALSMITYSMILGIGLVVSGQVMNILLGNPLWGGPPVVEGELYVSLKELLFITGICMIFGSFFLSLLDAHRTKQALQRSYEEVERKVAERTERLRESHAQLEHEMAERSAAEQALRQSHKMEAIGVLAGGIAHDFNNILMIVSGRADMVIEGIPPDHPVQEHVRVIRKATQRARDLVKQILVFSRAQQEELSTVPLHIPVSEALMMLRSLLPSTITLVEDIDHNTGSVLVDPAQIQQILMNLCANAFYAMREGQGTLRVSLQRVSLNDGKPHPEARAGEYHRLSVTDTGCGIPKEILDHIFDPFFTTKPVGEGTGLGLAMVHGVAAKCGGFVLVDSVAGQGSTFSVYLPKVQDAPVDTQAPPPRAVRGQGRILLVDDEPDLVDMIQLILGSRGYSVNGYTSSQEGLEAFLRHPEVWDLALVDHTMPHITGLELSRKLLELRPDLPILLCTGFGESITPEIARNTGLREVLIKPVSTNDLQEAVARHLPSEG